MLTVHDTVAQKNFDPVLPPLPDDLYDELEEESVKIVRLVKSQEPLVRTLKGQTPVTAITESGPSMIECLVLRGQLSAGTRSRVQ